MLPEVGHGVIPDTGGVARLFQICGAWGRGRPGPHGQGDDRRRGARPRHRLQGGAARQARRGGACHRGRRSRRRRPSRCARHDGSWATWPCPRSSTSMDEEMIAQTFIAGSRRHGRDAGRTGRGPDARSTGGADPCPDFPNRHRSEPAPSRPGPSTPYRCSITGAGTGLGKAIAIEFARLGACVVIASRKQEHLDAGAEAVTEVGGRVATVICDIREPEQIAAAFDAARGCLRVARRAGQQRRGQLPGSGRGHVAQRVADRGRHHPQRDVLLLP